MKRPLGAVMSVFILLVTTGAVRTQTPQPRAHLHPAYYDDPICTQGCCPCVPTCPDFIPWCQSQQ